MMAVHRPEHALQVKVLAHLTQYGRPDLYWFAIPNGDLRHPSVGRRLKAEGVKPGSPDLCVMLEAGRTGWLELKAPRGVLSDAQKGFAARADRLGHLWAVARNMEQAIEALTSWGVMR